MLKNIRSYKHGNKRREQQDKREDNTNRKDRPARNSFKSLRPKSAQVGIPQNDPEVRMYVKSLLHGIEINLLVDTGATLSVLSSKVYDSLKTKPALYHTEQVISSAGGTTLNVLGER